MFSILPSVSKTLIRPNTGLTKLPPDRILPDASTLNVPLPDPTNCTPNPSLYCLKCSDFYY